MRLDYIQGPLDGDSWEKLCISCYRMKYQEEHYTEIPAVFSGDAGIEGFTRNGIVNQCYCPEREYPDDELHIHLRDKMTEDISKLVSSKYARKLKELGVPTIKEWHFVIPYYKDSRILQHAESKRQEVLTLKATQPEDYKYIDDNFIIVIKQAEDFAVEITRIIRTTLSDVKLNFAIHHTASPDWSKCGSEKVQNINRKVKAVMGNVKGDDEDDFKIAVNTYIEAYISGIDILRNLRISYPEVYEEIFMLEQSYKKQVSLKTRMNIDSTINSKLFNEILDDFEKKLLDQFRYLTYASIIELKLDLVSGWLADCAMEFKKR